MSTCFRVNRPQQDKKKNTIAAILHDAPVFDTRDKWPSEQGKIEQYSANGPNDLTAC